MEQQGNGTPRTGAGGQQVPVSAWPPVTSGQVSRLSASGQMPLPPGADPDTVTPERGPQRFRYLHMPELSARQVVLDRSAAGRVHAGSVQLRQSGAGLVLGREVRIENGGTGAIAAGTLTAERTASKWLIGGSVHARQVVAIAVIAGRIDGQVRCLFDLRSAFAFGAGMALMGALLRLFQNRKQPAR